MKLNFQIQQAKRFSENPLSPVGKTKIRSGKDCTKRLMQVRHSLGTQCENNSLYSTKSCKLISHFASSKSPRKHIRRRIKSTKAHSGEATSIQHVSSVDSLESLTKKHNATRRESTGNFFLIIRGVEVIHYRYSERVGSGSTD